MPEHELHLPDFFTGPIDRLVQSIDAHTEAIKDNTRAIRHQRKATNKLTDAIIDLADKLHPPPNKATAVALTNIESEPLTGEASMAQFHCGVEGCKATLVFNGEIDGEPTLALVGPGMMSADPKSTRPSATDPKLTETVVKVHFQSPTDPGFFGLTGSALADNPETEEQESVNIQFDGSDADHPWVGEWIAATQPKATSVSLSTESEPIGSVNPLHKKK